MTTTVPFPPENLNIPSNTHVAPGATATVVAPGVLQEVLTRQDLSLVTIPFKVAPLSGTIVGMIKTVELTLPPFKYPDDAENPLNWRLHFFCVYKKCS